MIMCMDPITPITPLNTKTKTIHGLHTAGNTRQSYQPPAQWRIALKLAMTPTQHTASALVPAL